MNTEKNTVPLERALSKLGVLSRNNTRRLIDHKRVKVNGRVITSHFFPVNIGTDVILVDDAPVEPADHVYILTHKVKGQLPLFVNDKTRATVFKELPPEIHHLVPAGRLDTNAEGLFIYTNDTKWARQVIEYEETGTEVYIVRGEGELSDDSLEEMKAGVVDMGDMLRFEDVVFEKHSSKTLVMRITLRGAGRTKLIRRMLSVFQFRIFQVLRVRLGGLELGDLPRNEGRLLTPEEKNSVISE
ncbi:MAG: hypothetical protein AMXMBFR48_30080 [Ignavibacteriales bacterium]|jgi:23S rRNA pseudouridine2605 synthase